MFYRFRKAIRFSARLVGVLPHPILRWLYRLTQPWPGLFFVFVRYILLANLCRRCGDNVFVGNNVTIQFFDRLSIGNNVSIHTQCYIDANGGIAIGNDVSIAHQTSLVAFEHDWSDSSQPIRKNPLKPLPISIADDVWIGAGVRILAGAKLSGRTIVAAGSVVTARTPSNGHELLAGVPAKPKKTLSS